MCRIRAWSCWDGDCTACQKFASSPPQCVTTLFGSSPPTTLILNSPSLKSLVKEGGTLLLLLLVLLLVLLRVVPPATFWTPGPLDDKNLCWVIFSHCHSLRWLVISICAGAFPESHIWSILTMVQLPHVFASSRTPHVLEYPRGLLLEPVISKTGFAHPVDRFRLSLSGCFNYICVFVWRNLLQLAPSSHQNSLFQIIGMQILVCCLHLVCWISVCRMQALVCCLHLVCRIWYAVCIWYAGFSFTFLRVYFSKCWNFLFLRG